MIESENSRSNGKTREVEKKSGEITLQSRSWILVDRQQLSG